MAGVGGVLLAGAGAGGAGAGAVAVADAVITTVNSCHAYLLGWIGPQAFSSSPLGVKRLEP